MNKLGFLPRIESIRGIAALMVVGYHVGGQFQDLPGAGVLDLLAYRSFMGVANGIGAVVAFFVLSGFVLARSLDRDPEPRRYLRSRVFRLFPAAIAVVALLAALHGRFGFQTGREGSFEPFNVVLNMLMIRSDINGPMWSTTVECFATPLILLGVLTFKRHGAQPLSVAIAILFGLSFWGPYVHALGGATNLAPLYAFLAGVLLHFRGERLAAQVHPRWAGAAALFALVVFCTCGARKQTTIVLMLECMATSAFVVLVVWHPVSRLFNPLDLRIVRFYGRISYSLYLLHMLGIWLALRMLAALQPDRAGLSVFGLAALTTVASVLLITPLAYLSWRFIEVPFIALGRHLGRPLAAARAIEAGR